MLSCIRSIPVWPFTYLAPAIHQPIQIDPLLQQHRNAIKTDLEKFIEKIEQRLRELANTDKSLSEQIEVKVGQQMKYMNEHNQEYDPIIQFDTTDLLRQKQINLITYQQQQDFLADKRQEYANIIQLLHSHEVEATFVELSTKLGLPNSEQVDDIKNKSSEVGSEIDMGLTTIVTPSPLRETIAQKAHSRTVKRNMRGTGAGGGGEGVIDYDALMQKAILNQPQYQAIQRPYHVPGTKQQQQQNNNNITTTTLTTSLSTSTTAVEPQPAVKQANSKQLVPPTLIKQLFPTTNATQA